MHNGLLKIIRQYLTTDNKHKRVLCQQIVVFYLISPSAVNRSLSSEINSRGFVRLFCSCGSLGVSKTSCRVKKYFFFTIHQRRYQSSNEQLSLIRVSFTIALNVLTSIREFVSLEPSANIRNLGKSCISSRLYVHKK